MHSSGYSRRDFNSLLVGVGVDMALSGLSAGGYAATGPIGTNASGEPSPFTHPGMLQCESDLRRMQSAVRKQRQPVLAGFERMRDDPHSKLSYRPAGASEEVGRNPNVRFEAFDSDANAAFQCALMGHITEDPLYFDLCARILDDWATTLKRVTGADAILCAGLGGFKFANAGELLRSSPGRWPREDAERFGRMLREVLLPALYDFAPFANGNWDTAATKTMMAIAIYADDRQLFERALLYYMHGCGDGQLANYIYANGQCQESGRDQQHTQLGLAHMGDCCEMAWHQGIDLYGALDNRLLLGFEYTSRYLLGADVPFLADQDRTGKYKHTVISPRSALRNNFEQVYNHYVNRRGLSAPWTQKAAEAVRPEGPGFQADATGFGTLLYTRSARGEAVGDGPPAVGGVFAASLPNGLRVQWIPSVREASYHVTRTERSGASQRLVAESGKSELLDAAVRPGHEYSYRISVATGRNSASTSAVAGLPSEWRASGFGSPPLPGSVFFDGNTWRMRAEGGSASSGISTAYAAHTPLSARGSLVARLSPIFASQALHAGIVLLDEGPKDLPRFVVVLEPMAPSSAERVNWVVRCYAWDSTGSPVVQGEQKLDEPVVRYGRVYVPLWFKLEVLDGEAHGYYSSDGSNWASAGMGVPVSGSLRAGMLLNSGLGEMEAEVTFDRVFANRTSAGSARR